MCSYLAAIVFACSQALQLRATNIGGTFTGVGPIQELLPYLFLGIFVQVIVPQCDMYPAEDCFVKLRDAIRCQKHDTLAIF